MTPRTPLVPATLGLTIEPYEFDNDDLMAQSAAEDLVITDAAAAKRGWFLLDAFTALEKKIAAHHEAIKKPLNALRAVVLKREHDDLDGLRALKAALSAKLGRWQAAQDALDQQRRIEAQARADAEARAAQQALADAAARLADAEPSPDLRASFAAEAGAIAAAPVVAPAVILAPSAPIVAGGHVRTTWSAEVDDLKALLAAWLAGRCHLDEDAIIAAVRPHLSKQAGALRERLGDIYPGTRAVATTTAITRTR